MSYLDNGAANLGTDFAPVLLDENTPDGALVIHSGTAGRIWIGTSSSVGPSNGTPLDPGASLTVAAGPTWAVLDTSATAPVPVYLSSKATSWQASPAVIATQTAAQLLQTGVPAKLLSSLIYTGTLPDFSIPAASFIPVDFSSSASIGVSISGISNPCLLKYAWVDPTARPLLSAKEYVSRRFICSAPGSDISFSSRVRSPTLAITLSNLQATPPTIRIYQSNQAIDQDELYGDLSFTASPTNLAAGANNVGTFNSKGGPHQFRVLWNNAYDSATSKSLVGFKTMFSNGTTANQWFVDGTFSTSLSSTNVNQQVGTAILPPGPLQLVFQARAASTAGVNIDLWSGSQ